MNRSSINDPEIPADVATVKAPRQDSWLVLGLIWLFLYGGAALLVGVKITGPVFDPDIWWHLQTGKWIVEHGTVPETDPFSREGANHPWLAYSWLFEVLAYQLYTTFGLLGIVALRVVFGVVVVMFLHVLLVRYEDRFIEGACLFAVAILALMPLLNERPWLFTIWFTTWTLATVLAVRRDRPWWGTWFLPFAFVLWANIHIQFIYGLVILFLACVAPLIDHGLGWSPPAALRDCLRSRAWWRLLILTVACAAGTLVNPYHVRLYGVVAEYATQTGVFDLIIELQAMPFRDPYNWAVLALALVAAFALGRAPQLSSFDVLFLAFAAFCGFRAQRDVWLIVLAAVALAPSIRSSPAPVKSDLRMQRLRTGSLVAALAMTVIGAACYQVVWGKPYGEEVATIFPEKAVAFIREQGYPGPLYHDPNWGGYLIWDSPGMPVALDLRTNLYGDQRILQGWKVWTASPKWKDDPDLKAAQVILAPIQRPLTEVLRLDPRYQLVYEDKVAAVFIRAKPDTVKK